MAGAIPQNPAWEREELILACDLVAQHSWRQIAASDDRVIELSAVLRRLPLHATDLRRPNFRNVNSVARKTADIVTNCPAYSGKATRGGKLDKQIIKEFLANPSIMHDVAQAILKAEADGEFNALGAPVDEEFYGVQEGRLLVRRHVRRERSAALRQKKISVTRRAGKSLACEICRFDFAETYGERGKGYIECHHILPLHIAKISVTSLSDLALVCANCHRMLHSRAPWLRPDQLRQIIGLQSR